MKADVDGRAALELGRAEREGAVLEALRKNITDEFDVKLAAEVSKLRREHGAWHTEIISGFVIGGLTVTVVALVSNPVLLVAVASGGGWVAGFAGVAQSLFTFCGVQSVIDAAAAAAAATAAAAVATAVI